MLCLRVEHRHTSDALYLYIYIYGYDDDTDHMSVSITGTYLLKAAVLKYVSGLSTNHTVYLANMQGSLLSILL